MTDLAFQSAETGAFDFRANGYDLVLDDGVLTAYVNSILRDGRASDDQLEPDQNPLTFDRRGHWSAAIDPNAPDGSLLWLINRQALTPDMPGRVEDVLNTACQWMVASTDGPTADVVRVEHTAQKAPGRGRINVEGRLYLATDTEPKRFTVTIDTATQAARVEAV